MAEAIAAYLHYLSIFLLFALLTLEHGLFKQPLDLQRARRLLRIDAAYGASAGLVLVTGAVRAVWFGKGLDYYLHNGLFHAKLGLFVLIGLLSILPTKLFLRRGCASSASETADTPVAGQSDAAAQSGADGRREGARGGGRGAGTARGACGG